MASKFFKTLATAAMVLGAASVGLAADKPWDEELYNWTPSSNYPNSRGPFTTREPATGRYVVVGDNQFSAATAFKILDRGGNAFDAAVGMAASMGITYPMMNDIFGGDAMIIVYSAKDGKVYTYNGTGWAPKAATIDRYIEEGGIPMYGILSVEVPGAFAGWMALLKDYGTMPLKEILEPTIDIAENGYVLPKLVELRGQVAYGNLNDAAKAIYGKDGAMAPYGTVARNPDYANLLREISELTYQEAEDFVYRGPLAREMVEFSKSLGGLLEYEDFAEFKAEKVEAHSTNYRGIDVYVCPPNSQGWALLEALNILEGYDLKAMGHNSAQYINVLTQALNLSLEDRNRHMADPRFHQNPLAMIQKPYAEARRQEISLDKVMADEIPVGAPLEFSDSFYGSSGDTTFMAIADEEGNIVACTTSICNLFGSGLMLPGRGLMLNNRMTYFFLDDEWANFLEPRKRTMQTITPSLSLKDGKPFLVFGTPGADVQEQAKLQVFLNVAEFGMNPQEAVEAPRFQSRHATTIMGHVSYPRTIQVEGRVPQEVRDSLAQDYGYTVQNSGEWEYMGLMGAISFDHDQDRKWGGADPRSDAVSWGW